MEDLEIAILIVVSLILLLSVVSIVLFCKEDGKKGYDYNRLLHAVNCKCSSCVIESKGIESFEDKSSKQYKKEKNNYWQNGIQSIGIDDATKKSHNEWHTDLLGKTTGSSLNTVADHDIDSNWRGLGWGKTYRQAHKADGARVVSSVDWEDMPSHPGLRWRCHQYDESPKDNTSENCPWPPDENKKRYL